MGVQSDLKALRSDLASAAAAAASGEVGGAAAGRQVAALQRIIDRAETDIRLKTEAVLQTALNDQYTTLPAIRDVKRSRGEGGGASRPMTQNRPASATVRLSAKEQHQARRQMDMLLKPTSAGARAFLQERFGVTAPPEASKRSAHKVLPTSFPRMLMLVGPAQAGLAACAVTACTMTSCGSQQAKGILMRKKTSKPGPILSKEARKDPSAPPPRLTAKDVGRGMQQLVERGLVPKHVDLTPAFVKTPAPVLCGQVPMHAWEDQFVKQEPYTNSLGFNLSGIRMDMIARAETVAPPPRTHTTQSMRHAPPSRATAAKEAGGKEATPVKAREVSLKVVAPGEEEAAEPLEHVADGGAPGEVATPRDYNTLLDEFSLHQFIIRRGKTLATTPEFESFRRKHIRGWGPIQDVIMLLERLLETYEVPIAYVDGNKLSQLAQMEHRAPTNDDLLECLVNLDQILTTIRLPGSRYKGSHRERNASLAVQAVFRGHLCRRAFRNSMLRFRAALIIQRMWKTITTARTTERVVENRIAARREHFANLAQRLAQGWALMQRRKRVVVHLPSLSREEAQRMSMHDFAVRQNAQLARLTWLAASDVEVIYVAPFPLAPDLMQYYSKLLQVSGHERPEDRFKVVFPENYDRFPSHFSLATVLAYSPRCLRRIKNFCKGKESYIVPGVVGPDDLKVACLLDMPLLGPEPQVAAVYGSKSGAKRIFSIAEVNTPPGAYDLYSEHETLHSLARLIFQRLDIRRWLFKIDDEFLGRGHAWLDVHHLQCHAALVREKARSSQIWLDPTKQNAAVNKVMEELVRVLPRRAETAHKDLFPSWEAYLETFTRVGGVIEAVPAPGADGAPPPGLEVQSPSVNLLVQPNGEVTVHSTHDHLFTPDYHYVGATFPQQSANRDALHGAARAVGAACFAKGIVGYVSVDFVAFVDPEGREKLWAVDLNIGMNDTAASFELFKFVTSGHYDEGLGLFLVDGEEPPDAAPGAPDARARGYAACDPLYHPNVAAVQYSVFFNLCRLKGVHFDLQEREGTAFVLVDSFAGGVLGMLCVARDRLAALRMLADGLDFVQLQLGISRSNSEKLLPVGSFRSCVREVRRRIEHDAALAAENEALREEEEEQHELMRQNQARDA